MEQSDIQQKLSRRLLLSRMRLLSTHGFYALLLMHMRFRLEASVETAATDGEFIYFAPAFMMDLSDEELDFVLLHEVLHAALRHCARGKGKDNEMFNIACDIVVNSTILKENNMNLRSITLQKYGESMHLTPDGEEGHLYSAEEVYEMLCNPMGGTKKRSGRGSGSGSGKDRRAPSRGKQGRIVQGTPVGEFRDDHSKWPEKMDRELWDRWTAHVVEAARAVEIRDPNNQRGLLPMFAQRILKELTKPQINWRTILSEFIQPEVNDYSFSPPDRRFSDSPFFLPDYNEMGEGNTVYDILFMIDTSGSMSDDMIAAAFSEIKGAIDQFSGQLQGWLGFFDGVVIPPRSFDSVQDLKNIRPVGGGGTDFQCIFDYVRMKMDPRPAYIVILTDGYAPIPNEKEAMGIPVLWLLNNEIIEPQWGKIARIEV